MCGGVATHLAIAIDVIVSDGESILNGHPILISYFCCLVGELKEKYLSPSPQIDEIKNSTTPW